MGSFFIVFNVGSSTLKTGVFDAEQNGLPLFMLDIDLQSGQCCSSGTVPAPLQSFPPNQFPEHLAEAILAAVLAGGGEVRACVHRVMHGGPLRRHAQAVDDNLLEDLERYEALCPLHQATALEVIRHLHAQLPGLLQLAVYDTAFHLGQSPLVTEYALPLVLRHDGIRAYGFHGISCQHVLRQLRRADTGLASSRLIVAHLGQGASLTAIHNGRSVASSMGFSTLEGLPMGTRSGHVDPGVLLYLLDKGWAKSRLTDLLYHQSGLLGLSGISADMRTLLASKEPQAQFAVDYFCYRVAREVASMAGALQGLDTLVFTGCIGEHQPLIRTKIVRQLGWLGAVMDDDANRQGAESIEAGTSLVKIRVVPAGEEREMFLQATELERTTAPSMITAPENVLAQGKA